MSYSMYLCLALATVGQTPEAPATDPEPELEDAVRVIWDRIRRLVEDFRAQPLTPATVYRFENDLQEAQRELSRVLTEWTYNHLEPAAAAVAPSQVIHEGSPFRRLGRPTPQEVSTLFGKIVLRRWGYRAAPAVGAAVLFPLVEALGLVHGASPALAERAARYQAESGATQQQTLARLRREHGVGWGVKKLRQVTAAVATAMEEHRPGEQARQVLDWLAQAQASRGPHRPVLSVGRDGITLGVRCKGGTIYEVASTATVSVQDRRGRRLGTVYLGRVPESGQGVLSEQLTTLLTEVLRRWQGPVPRLCYVTDAGDNETTYYRKVLRRLRHPRTAQRLDWIWIVDYYHAAERLGTMAQALFGAGPRAWAWVRKMQKLLLKPGGLFRVLHSAAALRRRGQWTAKRRDDYRRAYNYLRDRGPHLQYAAYRKMGLPIGSGVTEAACKTVFTQRLKLSGMRWQKAGAQAILTLRVILLSGVWEAVYQHTLPTSTEIKILTPAWRSHANDLKAA